MESSCKVGITTNTMVSTLIPEGVNIINKYLKTAVPASEKFNCCFIEIHQSAVIAHPNETGFYPEDYYLDMLQRGIIDSQAIPTRLDQLDNPSAANMEVVVFDSLAT